MNARLKTVLLLGVPFFLLSSARATAQTLTLSGAREAARLSSPDIAALRAALDAASGRVRQADAIPNPVVSYGREQASAQGATAAQDIVALEQRVEIGGQRGARLAAARLRQQAAQARLDAALALLDERVAIAYADLLAAQRRAELGISASTQFARASVTTERRLAEGDVSGYAARRVKLDAARYSALAAQAQSALRTQRLHLAQLLGTQPVAASGANLSALTGAALPPQPIDSLIATAWSHNLALRAAELDVQAAQADVRLAARERVPTPALSAGYKRERTLDGVGLNGFIAGFSLPLPLWDRRVGAIEAASAEVRRVIAERDALRLRIAHEVAAALDAARQTDAQETALRAQLGDAARAALRAAEAAYAEGEITLAEWLDAVRAYQEAEAAYAAVVAESITQRALLERLLGIALIQ